jgi:hypothetical protein
MNIFNSIPDTKHWRHRITSSRASIQSLAGMKSYSSRQIRLTPDHLQQGVYPEPRRHETLLRS